MQWKEEDRRAEEVDELRRRGRRWLSDEEMDVDESSEEEQTEDEDNSDDTEEIRALKVIICSEFGCLDLTWCRLGTETASSGTPPNRQLRCDAQISTQCYRADAKPDIISHCFTRRPWLYGTRC